MICNKNYLADIFRVCEIKHLKLGDAFPKSLSIDSFMGTDKTDQGPEVIKLFILNSAEHELYPAHVKMSIRVAETYNR